jgi:MFS family permease
MIAFVLAVVGIVASLQAGAIVPFIAASLVVGVAQGAASTGGIRALLADVGQQERAGLLSTIYLISYSGAAIPGMIAGKLTNRFDLFQIALGYAALGIVASALAMLVVRNPVHARRASDEAASGIHEPPR